MTPLPWGWLSAAAPVMPDVEHDRVQLTPVERLTIGVLTVHFHDEVPCNYGPTGRPRCDAAAVWETHCPGCGYAWLHCEKHRRELDEFDAQAGPDDTVSCSTCRTVQPNPVTWNRL